MYLVDDKMPQGCIYENQYGYTEYCPMCNHDDVPYCQYLENFCEAGVSIDERPVFCPIKPIPKQAAEVQEILRYLDERLHPLVSPEHWNVYSELHDMISLIPTVPEERRWIPCSERLPEQENDWYLVTVDFDGYRTVERMYFVEGHWQEEYANCYVWGYDVEFFNVVAWMPLPECYESIFEEK